VLIAIFNSPKLIYGVFMSENEQWRKENHIRSGTGEASKKYEIEYPEEVIKQIRCMSDSQQNAIYKSLECLFPWHRIIRPESILHKNKLNNEKRLCVRRYRDRYFSFNISEYEISDNDFERITSSSSNGEFNQWLHECVNNRNILDFLSMCEINIRNLSESIRAIIVEYLISSYWKYEEEYDTIQTENTEPELDTIELSGIRRIVLELLPNDPTRLLKEYNHLLEKYGFCIFMFRLYVYIDNISIQSGTKETEQELESIRNNILCMIINNYIQQEKYQNRHNIDKDIFCVLAKYGNKDKTKIEIQNKLRRENKFAFTILNVFQHHHEFEVESYEDLLKYALVDPDFLLEVIVDIYGDTFRSIKETKHTYMLEREEMECDEILARQFAAIHNAREKDIIE